MANTKFARHDFRNGAGASGNQLDIVIFNFWCRQIGLLVHNGLLRQNVKRIIYIVVFFGTCYDINF